MSCDRGLVTRIDDDWMYVKVPTGIDCGACSGKSACTFRGPAKAYRTVRVVRTDSHVVGDQVVIEQPVAVLGVVLLVMLLVPVLLLAIGYQVDLCCGGSTPARSLIWVIGFAIWIAALYGANRWLSRAPRFQPRCL